MSGENTSVNVIKKKYLKTIFLVALYNYGKLTNIFKNFQLKKKYLLNCSHQVANICTF
jgi:hypothetical protein